MPPWLQEARTLAGASLAMAIAAAACSGGRVHAEPGGSTMTTCADRDRAHSLCVGAVASQCAARHSECESGCEASADARLGPGSSEKEPALRGDIRSARCRQDCDLAAQQCERPLLAQCPPPCPPLPADAGALQPDETADAN